MLDVVEKYVTFLGYQFSICLKWIDYLNIYELFQYCLQYF